MGRVGVGRGRNRNVNIAPMYEILKTNLKN